MRFDPSTISIIALFLSLAMGIFTVYTFKQKASHDELEQLRSRVRELETEVASCMRERSRLERENYKLMADLLANKRNDT